METERKNPYRWIPWSCSILLAFLYLAKWLEPSISSSLEPSAPATIQEVVEEMGLDESRMVVARPGEDIGATLGGLLDVLRKAKKESPESIHWTIEGGGWFDEQGTFKIGIAGDFFKVSPTASLGPASITLVPDGAPFSIQ